jgi:protocatechuate 3,4-dioxygenase alpha subunit
MSADFHALPSQTIGPFYHFSLTVNPALACMAGPGAKGERIHLELRILDGDDRPIPDAMIELWQADAEGKYQHPDDPQNILPDPGFTGFGRSATDDAGVCRFETIRPGPVPDGAGRIQAPHINVSIFARGLLSRLATRVYFAGDPRLADDPVFQLVPSDRRATLIAEPDPDVPARWKLDVHLQGDRETVFFDL